MTHADPERDAALSSDERRRYSRHILLPEIGEAGQRRLKASSALLVGAGGLGSPAALYLAAAGVGRIGIADFDRVDETNLQRQILHGTSDIGRPKVDSARDRLLDVNPSVAVERHAGKIDASNVMTILRGYDVVLDGSDNFSTRYLLNDACVLLGIPNVHGSVFRFEGQLSVFGVAGGPCYRCLHPQPPPPGLIPDCATGGVLGVLPGVIGTLQATEAIKLLAGIGEPLVGRLLVYQALPLRFRELRLTRDPACPACGDHPTIRAPADIAVACATQSPPETAMRTVQPRDLKRELDSASPPFLLDVREPREFDLCRIPGGVLIPLAQVPLRLGELDRDADIVVYCRSGGRSGQATLFLQQQGFSRVRNLTGGILAWSDQVDPSVPKY